MSSFCHVLYAGQSSSAPAPDDTTQTVSGQVLNAVTGLPVPRALVKLNERAVLTDHEGKFTFPQFSSSGSNNLQVSKPGYYASVDPSDGGQVYLRTDQLAQPVELRLYPEALLTGTLTGPDGRPLPRISVIARRSIYTEISHRWMPVGQAFTDSHGSFRLAVPPGDYRLETSYTPRGASSQAILPIAVPGESPSSTIHVASGSEEHFDLSPSMSQSYAVIARIEPSGERGFPMITARSSNGLTIPLNSFGRSAGPGELRLELPAGTYTLTALQNAGDVSEYGETTVTVVDHDISGVVLHLSPVAPIPVQITVDSEATQGKTLPTLQQLALVLDSTQDAGPMGSSMFSVMTDRDGQVSFHATPGTYRLEARGRGSWFIKAATYGTTDLLTKDLTVSPGTGGDIITLTVSDQTGGLKGTVALNGAPSQCWLYVIPTGPSATPVYWGRSGSDGTYNLANLPPGTYKAIAFEQHHSANYLDPGALDGFSSYVRTVTISAGSQASLDLDAVPVKEMTQ